MLVHVLLAGSVLFFINSCRTPMHFVGYQLRNHKFESKIMLPQHLLNFLNKDFHHFSERGCEYYQHKKSMYYYTLCQNQNIVFIGTDVRNAELNQQSNEEVLQKIDKDSSARVGKVKELIANLESTELVQPKFTVYNTQQLTEF